MKNKKSKIGIIVILTIVLIAVFSTLRKPSVVETQGELVEVEVAQFGDFFLYMPLYLADKGGFFEEEGLKVNITSTGGDDKTFATVIGGSADFGIADPTFVAIAREKGQRGKVIASIVNGVPFWGVTFDSSIAEIKDASQLEGYSVATFPSPSTAYSLQYDMFKDAGLEPHIRQASFGALLPLLHSGDVDIALELEPNVSLAVKEGAKVVYSMADMYGDFAITGVTVSEETIQEKPQMVQSFVNALQKAQTYAHKNPQEALKIAKELFPDLDEIIVSTALARILDSKTFPDNVLISDEAWLKAIYLRHDIGDLESIEMAKNVLDMNFAQSAINNK